MRLDNKSFFRRVISIVLPMIVQNGITQFVSLLDNIMVGQVGTIPMSGVSIMNQLMFVFNLCIFGACSGAGIFTAQFHGSQDYPGIRHTFRFKVLACILLSFGGIALFLTKGPALAGLYLTGEGDPADAAAALGYGMEYLDVMLIGLLPFALANAYAGTLRETGQTFVPMAAGVVAVLVNLVLNYILIFGHFGAPAMGVSGAAVATVISRFAELAIVAGWTHRNAAKNPYIQGAFRSLYIPGKLFLTITVKGMPLLVNEFLWSTGMALLNQCYSTCGLDVVPAMNISTTLMNLASVTYLSMGNAVGILMGQMLGARLPEPEIRSANRKLILISMGSGLFFGGMMAATCRLFPGIYNTTAQVRTLASQLILISSATMVIHSYLNAVYFTLRSGGQTFLTFLFDSFYVWVVSVPIAFCLSRFTDIGILPLFAICQASDLLKCGLGAHLLKKGTWIQNLT